MGTISSVTASDLVLDHKYKGKEESTKFVLNSDTKKEGNLDKGEMATVYYRMERKNESLQKSKRHSRNPRPNPRNPRFDRHCLAIRN